MIKLRNLRCSFCRKNESAVAKLVAGPRVYICDECVAIASRIMESGGPGDPRPEAKAAGLNLLDRVRRIWRGGSHRRVARNAHC